MPRKKFAVHSHFRRAPDQGDRKIELVECIHCGHRTAGNNAARLLKHLQSGCWPASGPDDPSLQLDRPTNAHDAASRMDPNLLAAATLQGVSARPSTLLANPANATSSALHSAGRGPTASPFLLINATVKETKDPVVSRFLAIPRTFTFRNLQRALSVAFGYKSINGLFDITYPAWIPGKGRPPRRQQVCIFHDEEQRSNWHAWDDIEGDASQPDERFMDAVAVDALLEELKSCKIVFHVGPWAHEVEILGNSTLSSGLAGSRGHAIPVCLSGQGHAVPENSDALMWQAFKDAYSSSIPSPTQKAYRLYYERECPTGDPRGLSGAMPWKWDVDHVNRDLKLLPAVAVLPPSASEEPQHSVDDSPDEDEDEDGSNPDENQVPSAHARGNSAGQNDHVMYDQTNRGLPHQMQQSPYALGNPVSATEPMRYT